MVIDGPRFFEDTQSERQRPAEGNGGRKSLVRIGTSKLFHVTSYKVNVTRNLPVGTEIVCVGQVSHGGRSTGVASGELRGAEDGKLYATGSTTCLVMEG